MPLSADPARSIPIATFASMSVVTLAYVAMSASLTLMVPYYQVHPTAAFSDAFALRGATVAKIAVSVGALCGMTTSLAKNFFEVGGMFALPRCVYAMAEDGLLFNSLAVVNGRTQVPINAVLVFGSLTAVIALVFDIETLVEFLSIGTLLAYSIVSACVIILRYQPARRFLEQFDPGHAVHYGVAVMMVGFSGFGLCLSSGHFAEISGMVTASFFGAVSIISLAFIMAHHQNSTPLDFKVPLVPLVPALSLLVNVLMMLHLAPITWLRLAVWMTIAPTKGTWFPGLSIYFIYGMRHSREEALPSSPDARFSKSSTYESVVSAATTVAAAAP
ncbi:unnamed protein product [Heligmosomoides polygyrus]|uniref:AA_permease_C domain-containing protein n=1 Tax=Heligmosomoides polygyrus TaxID=6339 RepID=A0A183FZ72_HELPZ|nr:unnamed protein product [Heligmosomoides polygyrus]